MIDPYKFRDRNFYKNVFLEKKKNLKRFDYLLTKKNIKCCLCKSSAKKLRVLKVNKRYELLKCKNCGLVTPNIETLKIKDYTKIIYKDFSKKKYTVSKKKKSSYRNLLLKKRFNYCIKNNFKNFRNIKVLEIGCGTGEFLKILKKKKIFYKGLEVDERQIQQAKNSYLNVTNTVINKEKNNFYDLILMFDVFEHVVDPLNYLKIVFKKMKKNSLLICYMPNINSISFDLLKENNNLIYPFEHLNFFNEKSINFIAKKTKLKIDKLETFGLDMIDYFFFREFKDKKKYFKFIMKELNIMQEYIDKNNLGNHYRLTLKK